MAKTFNLPAVGDTMVEGEIVEWFVAVGDVVDLDQVICSLATDKSVVDMSTPHRGTVLALGAQVGEVVDVGAPLLIVGDPGEAVPTPSNETPVAAAPITPPDVPSPAMQALPIEAPSLVLSPLVRRAAAEKGVDLSMVVGTGVGGRITTADVDTAAREVGASPTATPAHNGTVHAMPKVRKAARERSIDLHTISGSGPHGSITLDDLDTTTSSEQRVRLSPIRRSIAEHLTRSVQEIPQFTSLVEFDATALLATRAALRESTNDPIPLDALFMALTIPVLRDHPIVNAYLDGDEIVYLDRYDLGVAVDTQDGLMVPVVRHADQRSVTELGAEIVRLATEARERRIQPQDLVGQTMTINNVGAVGILAGTPILPVGNSSIVAFGTSKPTVQLRAGNPVEVPIITISATFDHRIIDGGDAGRFLTQLARHLEVPALGLL